MNIRQHLSSQTAIELKRQQADELTGPGVYIYLQGDTALYVGSSKQLGWRSFKRCRKAEAARATCTSILLIPCLSHASAIALEEQLIADLRPQYNKNGGLRELTERLGLSSTHNAAIYRKPITS
jgi:excinuclease UvrABC nuclease subunit